MSFSWLIDPSQRGKKRLAAFIAPVSEKVNSRGTHFRVWIAIKFDYSRGVRWISSRPRLSDSPLGVGIWVRFPCLRLYQILLYSDNISYIYLTNNCVSYLRGLHRVGLFRSVPYSLLRHCVNFAFKDTSELKTWGNKWWQYHRYYKILYIFGTCHILSINQSLSRVGQSKK